ncbi:MAG: hypothetical protein ACTHQM_06445 [Thermoanaerobaculia bacterium]
MSPCCPHPDQEHQLLATCQKVIHYPSEDYPCLCTGFRGEGETCAECEHEKSSHVVTRVCKPASGEYCNCGH